MNPNIKESIIDTAQQLFRQKGYNSISMRDIAEALNISVGNLTYHFKKKEDLIEATVLKQHLGYKKPAAPQTLQEMDAFFRRIFSHQSKQLYYFSHFDQLAELCPAVYSTQLNVMNDIQSVFEEALHNLEQAGLLRIRIFAHQRESFLQTIMILCVHSISSLGRVQQSNPEESARCCLWSILAPCLTPEGLTIFGQMFPLEEGIYSRLTF